MIKTAQSRVCNKNSPLLTIIIYWNMKLYIAYSPKKITTYILCFQFSFVPFWHCGFRLFNCNCRTANSIGDMPVALAVPYPTKTTNGTFDVGDTTAMYEFHRCCTVQPYSLNISTGNNLTITTNLSIREPIIRMYKTLQHKIVAYEHK